MQDIDEEHINTLRLIRSENVGLKTFWYLINLYKSPSTAIEKIAELSLKGGKSKSINICSRKAALDEFEECSKKNIKLISFFDQEYPKLLRTTEDCPPILFALGNIGLLNKESIAIVGSRNASANGLRFSYKLAKNLGEQNFAIISGFARGIDSAAHKASINKASIAVLAGGVDHIYPPENEDLYYQIIEQGLVISESRPGAIPKPQNFPQRNRIISGISKAVAIIEASLNSGSLITAKYALQQNKDLFVVPGFPLDPKYQGNNSLLKQGAYLLESAQDIIDVLANYKINYIGSRQIVEEQSVKEDSIEYEEKDLRKARDIVLNFISTSPTTIEEIIITSKFSASIVLTIIVELELAGKITRHYGNKISLNAE